MDFLLDVGAAELYWGGRLPAERCGDHVGIAFGRVDGLCQCVDDITIWATYHRLSYSD